jgi:A/G-specific adenine glycosylase
MPAALKAVASQHGASLAGLAQRVIDWQARHGRHGLPWQGTRDAYRVWLSEIMLQQTQVTTVLGYYQRFLQRFPGVAALAAAPQDDVLALWSGLGYYSRARNLHRCAQVVVAEHGGVFPRSSAGLATLPGIGRSTAAAIAAFCFDERVAILDGNVKRVLARATGFAGDLALAAQQRALWAIADSLLPDQGMVAYTQGLMDLGATLCTLRRPRCSDCPLADTCMAHRNGRPQDFPVKTHRLKRGQRHNALLWLQRPASASPAGTTEAALWLTRRPETGVWAGLWSMPEFATVDAALASVQPWPGSSSLLPAFSHALTHFDWQLAPVLHRLPVGLSDDRLKQIEAALPPGRWVPAGESLALGLPAPVRRLLEAGLV